MLPRTTRMTERIANTREDVCTKPEEVWCTQMAHNDQQMAIDAGRLPTPVAGAYLSVVKCRENLIERCGIQ